MFTKTGTPKWVKQSGRVRSTHSGVVEIFAHHTPHVIPGYSDPKGSKNLNAYAPAQPAMSGLKI